MMSETQSQPRQEAQQKRSGMRSLFWAIAALLVLSGAMLAIQTLSGGAVLDVQADRTAAAVMGTSSVTVHQTDGALYYTLREGQQSVSAGDYRIEVDFDDARLEFSTGPTFSVRPGERLTIQVTGEPIEP